MRDFKIYIFLFVYCVSVLSGQQVFAQKSSVRATIEPVEIQIGEQALLNLEVITPKGRTILFPIYPDTIVSGIEVLTMLPPDTTIAHEVMTINQKYIVTSFDSALYHIPYIPVLDGTDTIKSNSFGLKVTAPDLPPQVLSYLDKLKAQETDSIDFEQLALNDIKEVLKPPFVWQDYLQYIWLVLLLIVILALLGVGIYFAMRKKTKGYFFKPQVIQPPHVLALQALDKIKADKIWQHGLEKQFYTEVMDVLREYIEKRFYINAFEKTSDEILENIRYYIEADSSIESLEQVLKLADLVKFAKYKPLQNENDLSLVNSYLFVNQTKKEEASPVSTTGEAVESSRNETDSQIDENRPAPVNKEERKENKSDM